MFGHALVDVGMPLVFATASGCAHVQRHDSLSQGDVGDSYLSVQVQRF